MASAEEAEYADVDGYTPMQHDKYMLPFKKYMENAGESGKTKGEYLPFNIVNFYDFGEHKIQYYKHFAKNVCSAYAISPIHDNMLRLENSQKKLARARGEAVNNLHKHHRQQLRGGDGTNFTLEQSRSEHVIFEKIITYLDDARKDTIHQEPIRFVLQNTLSNIFSERTTNDQILDFVELLLKDPEISPLDEECLRHMRNVIRNRGFTPKFVTKPETLDGRFEKHNDIAKTERAESNSHIWTYQNVTYEVKFHKDVPRFPATKMYMHTGVLEASNQLIRKAFSNQTFSLEMTLTYKDTGNHYERRYIAYNGYKKGKSNVYDLFVGLNVDIPETPIKEIMEHPPDIVKQEIRAKHLQHNKVNRLKEMELLQLHMGDEKSTDMYDATSVMTYVYNYTFWTFIATFYQLNAPQNGYTHGVHITLLHRLSEMVNEWQGESQERLQRMRTAQETVNGQNQILRGLIVGLNQRIRALPYRRTTLPKGDGGTWLIFGMNRSDQRNADTDMFIHINRLSSTQRESMERKSNLVKAHILRKYYQQAITESNAQGKKVLEYLYALPDVQNYLARKGYTIQGKIAPGIFVLICKALPTGYPPQAGRTPAIVAWRTEMTALLTEFTGTHEPKPIKNDNGVFHPMIEYYISSVLAHQNHNTRNPPMPIDMTGANQYQAGYAAYQAGDGAYPNWDGAYQAWYGAYGGSADRFQSARRGQPQIQLEPPHPAEPDSKLREEVDALRRTVNQLALMGPA
jgi:hypothetical protein